MRTRTRFRLAAVVAASALTLTVTVTGCEDSDGGDDGGASASREAGEGRADAGAGVIAGADAGTGSTATPSAGPDDDSDTGADDDSDALAPTRNGGTSGGPEVRQKWMLENLPQADTVMAAGEYLQRFTTCERYSIDPSDERYYPMDEKFDMTWGVQFRGTCDDGGNGWIRVFKTSDMKQFQTAYKAEITERMKTNERAGIEGGFAIGKDFAVIAPDGETLRDLSGSSLLELNCNPNFEPQGDVSTAPALIDGCLLTDEFIEG
ncbi:hypothetical protein [Streptomyces sp. NPDC051214]|uniref:hypothetical protein n=1 Tax=Streptomyces sp. NPDC051214 TaxID=3155282 RepID=UPI003430F266